MSEEIIERSQEIGNDFFAWTPKIRPCPIDINNYVWFKRLCGLFETQAMLEANVKTAKAEIERLRDILEAIGESYELLSGSQLRLMVENGLHGGMEWQAIYKSIQSVLEGGEK